MFVINCSFASNSTGYREVYAYKNGTGGTILTQGTLTNATTGVQTSLQCSFIADLSVGDYVEAFVYQTSGGALNVLANSQYTTLQLVYLGA